jgi:hypothetical protein
MSVEHKVNGACTARFAGVDGSCAVCTLKIERDESQRSFGFDSCACIAVYAEEAPGAACCGSASPSADQRSSKNAHGSVIPGKPAPILGSFLEK